MLPSNNIERVIKLKLLYEDYNSPEEKIFFSVFSDGDIVVTVDECYDFMIHKNNTMIVASLYGELWCSKYKFYQQLNNKGMADIDSHSKEIVNNILLKIFKDNFNLCLRIAPSLNII